MNRRSSPKGGQLDMRTYAKQALAVKQDVATDYRTPQARAVREQLNQIVHYAEWSEMVAFCATNLHHLSEREYYFIKSMVALDGKRTLALDQTTTMVARHSRASAGEAIMPQQRRVGAPINQSTNRRKER
jgi:hypothetical protein